MPLPTTSVALACSALLAFAPPTSDTWDESDAPPAPTAGTVSPGVTAAPANSWTPPPEPDPALKEHNLKLSAKMHKGERWMIGGRVGLALTPVPILIGVIGLGVHGARMRAYRASDGMLPRPGNGALGVGVAFMTIGVGGVVASAVFAGLGFKKVQEARAGQLGFSVGRRMTGLTYTRRF